MSSDPFEQFERSRAGMLIPVALFALGATLTFLAIRSLDPQLVTAREKENDLIQAAQEAAQQLEYEDGFTDTASQLETQLKAAGVDTTKLRAPEDHVSEHTDLNDTVLDERNQQATHHLESSSGSTAERE